MSNGNMISILKFLSRLLYSFLEINIPISIYEYSLSFGKNIFKCSTASILSAISESKFINIACVQYGFIFIFTFLNIHKRLWCHKIWVLQIRTNCLFIFICGFNLNGKTGTLAIKVF